MSENETLGISKEAKEISDKLLTNDHKLSLSNLGDILQCMDGTQRRQLRLGVMCLCCGKEMALVYNGNEGKDKKYSCSNCFVEVQQK